MIVPRLPRRPSSHRALLHWTAASTAHPSADSDLDSDSRDARCRHELEALRAAKDESEVAAAAATEAAGASRASLQQSETRLRAADAKADESREALEAALEQLQAFREV